MPADRAVGEGGAPAGPRLGYELLAAPPGTRFREVRRFGEIDSTNGYLLDEAAQDAAEGLVVLAAHQIAGRGRLDRRWESPPGANLLASVLLRPQAGPAHLQLYVAALAMAAADACSSLGGVEPALKWPNDLVVGDRKLAGVLAELRGAPATGQAALVVGIGLNVAWPPPDGPGAAEGGGVGLAATATSLLREGGRAVSPEDLLEATLVGLEPRLAALEGPVEERLAVASEYRRRCSSLARRVRVETPDGTLEGTVADVTVEGHLIVDVGACLRTVTAGDVIHLHPGS